jgi:hypothetical protein
MASVGCKLEAFLCDQFSQWVPDMKFRSSSEDGVVTPPFAVVNVTSSEEQIRRSNIYRCEGAVVLITHIDDSSSDEHSNWLEAIKAAFDNIIATCPKSDTGMDIGSVTAKDSVDDQAHGNFITFTAGVTG